MLKPEPIQPNERRKVLVAMSGGVDSSVAACLLHHQGHDVMGLFMRVGAALPPEDCPSAATDDDAAADGRPADPAVTARSHQGCCSAADAADARFVAGMLGIPFYVLNFQRDFDRIIDYFAAEYAAGRTPNPCVQCNAWLKFGKLIEYADAVGADHVATGHYARLARRGDRVMIQRGRDPGKDQSYFLFGVAPDALQRAMFPIGDLYKSEVRALAERFGLPVTNKPDSVEICFVPDRDYARVVRQRRPDAFREGRIVDRSGNVMGRHDGIVHFTVGQRRGLRVAAGQPVYVTQLDHVANTVTLGSRAELLHRSLVATEPNLLCGPLAGPIRCTAKIRYQHEAAACTARLLDDGQLQVNFDDPQPAIAPGQAVVLYDDEIVLGGGWIKRSE